MCHIFINVRDTVHAGCEEVDDILSEEVHYCSIQVCGVQWTQASLKLTCLFFWFVNYDVIVMTPIVLSHDNS